MHGARISTFGTEYKVAIVLAVVLLLHFTWSVLLGSPSLIG